jgi:TolA-binding protein
MRTPVTHLVALAVAVQLGGCFFATSKKEGQDLRRDVDAVKTGLGARVEKLEKVLGEATALLTRNSADLGADLGTIGEEQRKLNGLVQEAKRLTESIVPMVEQHEVKLGEMEQRLQALEAKGAAPVTKSAAELWSEGQGAMSSGDFARAELAFRTLVVKYPADDRADDAQFGRGESLARARSFDKALPEFQKVYEKYPTSSLAAQGLFRAGEVAEELKWCTDARAYYGLLRQKYPKSPYAKKAQARETALKKIVRDRRQCQS